MIRRFRFDGGAAPFEGRREVLWRRLPAGAEIASARATVVPAVAGEGGEPFIERIDFAGGRGDWRATKQAVPGNWVEVDFHARRTLVSLTGSGLADGAGGNAQLLVDLGGVFHRVSADGSLGGPASPPFLVAGNTAPLPGLAVTRLRLVRAGANPDVASVLVSSVPTNVSLALGELPPFWTRPGELAAAETTPDFASVLQAVLAEAEVEHGFYALPLVVRSDAIARLTVELEIDFAVAAAALPSGLDEASLSYDFGGVPKGGAALPALAIPAGSRVCATRGRAVGSFAASRIVLGPTGAVTPAGSVEISPAATQARLLALDVAAGAGAVDLLLSAVDRTVGLELDVREDLDGKPGSGSLLGATVPFRLDRASAAGPTWVSVPLPRELQFPAGRVWLVVQSTAGTAAWHVAAGGPAMQRTTDGALSWRQSPAAGAGGPVDRPAGHFRLRRTGDRFSIPIELEVGGERVSLARFAPLGRVEVALDVPEVAAAINRALAQAAPGPCPEVEHLADGDFSRWIGLGDEPTPGFDLPLGPATASATAALLALAADGRRAFVATGGGEQEARLHVVNLDCAGGVEEIALGVDATPVAFAVDPAGALGFVAFEHEPRIHPVDLAARRPLDGAVNLPFVPSALAVSEDGERLFMGYAAVSATGGTGGGDAGVAAVAVARLAEVARGGAGGQLAEGDVEELPLGSGRRPRALAAAGGRLYALVGDEPSTGEFVRLFVRPLGAEPAATEVDRGIALAIARGGDLALVARAHGDAAAGVAVAPALAILDARSGRRLGDVPLGIEPLSVTASPDGRRAFVAGRGGLAVVDLGRRREVTVLRAEQDLAAVAVAPGGERVFATRFVVEDPAALAVMPIGVPALAEWALLGGRAAPVCLGRPAAPAVLLGDPTGEQPAATTLAQAAPASGGCRYALSFAGLASEEDARVEVVWRGDGCAALGRDAVPIRAVAAQPRIGFARQAIGLAAHRERFTAPPAATQAEVRIAVPFGFAALQALSLRATAEAVDNADLRLTAEDGSPRGWRPGAAGAPAVVAGAAGGRLANPGGREVSLVQVVPAQASGRFALELEAAPVTAGDGPAGRLDLTWLGGEGERLGESVTLEVVPAAFDLQAAAGEVPAGAVEARLELSVAPGSRLDVRRVSLRSDRPAELPVTFIAQAPGELTVTGWQICHEPIEPMPPAVPEAGLCSPAPAASEKGAEGECFCSCCGSRRKMKGVTAAVTGAGRPAAVGTCSGCGAPAVGFGGRPVPGAEPLPVLASPPARRLEPAVLFARAAGPATASPAAEPAPITAVIGIGRARAQELAAIGIDSLARLSFASPERVAAALRGVSPELAADFIRQARRRLAPR